jgi:hypothetical protein
VAVARDGTFGDWLEAIRSAFGGRSFANLKVLATGWVLAGGARTVTAALVASRVAGVRHHAAFHRFFSRAKWCPDEVGRLLFERLLAWVDSAAIEVVLDDTLAAKKGPKVFGLGTHLDAVRSTRRHRIFSFGHVWVVLAVRVKLPFSARAWALPILFRLYRNEKECVARGDAYRKKTELAREMLDVVAAWTDRRVHVLCDLAYCCDTVQRALPERFVTFGTMRPDAVLTALPTAAERKATGRRRRRGTVLPKPEELARDASVPWLPVEATLYGRRVVVQVKSMCAQWYQACGTKLLHIVVVRTDHGHVPWRAFFSADADAPAVSILETYAGRWAIEVTFRDLKQHLGFADSPARLRLAVERVAPFVGLLFTSLALWTAERAGAIVPPLRPWYTTKRGLSFEDILYAARAEMPLPPVFDPARASENLPNCRTPRVLRRARAA